MNPETPLTEVAAHLSVQAADFLGNQRQSVQIAVLSMARHCIWVFEQSGLVFDPMTYQTVVDQMVASLSGAYNAGAENAELIERLKQISMSGPPGPDVLQQLQEALNGR